MNKTFLILIIFTFLTSSSFIQVDEVYRTIHNNSFKAGEYLVYRVHYGFVNAGEGVVETGSDIVKINNRPCYRTSVTGRTTGTFDVLYKIRDTWRSYVDTSAMLSQRFYWNVNEGKFHKEETVFFDQVNNKIRSEEKDQDTHEFDKTPNNLQDIVSGYYYLRTFNFNKLKEGEQIPLKGFFDDKYYDFKIKYAGKEVVKTKFGKINCIRLNPIMPKNELFKDNESVRLYISDDENKIPIKVEADMFVGAVEVELKDVKNTRHPLHFVK